MNKYINGKGTINGTQGIVRIILAGIAFQVIVGISGEFGDSGLLMLIPALAFYVWFILSTGKKRLQAYGWKGSYWNMIFPNLTDATYPNGTQKEE